MRIVRNTEKFSYPLETVKGGHVVAYKRHSTIKDPLDFLDDISELDYSNESIYDIMRVSDKLYKMDGICGKSIDIMNDFATTPLRMEPTKNKRFNRLVEIFFENVNVGTDSDPGVYHLMQRLSLEYLVLGNCVPLKSWQKLDLPKLGEVVFPTRILQLNPLNIKPEISNTQFGPRQLLYRLEDETVRSLKKDGRKSKQKKAIPSLIKRRYKTSLKDSGLKTSNHIKLDPRLVRHIKRKARDYEDWGVPFLAKCFRPAAVVHKLQRLDEATLEGLINLITIFKVGSDNFPASQGRINSFMALLRQNNGVDPNKYIVWSHDIDVLQVGPDNKILSYEERYRDAILVLKNSLGIPDPLLGGKVVGNPYASFLGMLESLVAMRKALTAWIIETLFEIADQNNIELSETPVITWDRVNLTNEAEMKNLIMSFWDRGLIDPRTAVNESGRKYETILQNKKEIEKSGDGKYFTPPKLPFSNNPTDSDGPPEDGDVKEKKKEDDPEFDSTASIVESAYKQTVEHYIESVKDDLVNVKSEDAEAHIVGHYYELGQALNTLNDVNRHYGIRTRMRHMLEASQQRAISALSSGVEDCCDILDSEKDRVYSETLEIRKLTTI